MLLSLASTKTFMIPLIARSGGRYDFTIFGLWWFSS